MEKQQNGFFPIAIGQNVVRLREFFFIVMVIPVIVIVCFIVEAHVPTAEEPNMPARVNGKVIRDSLYDDFEADVILAEGRVMSVYLEPISKRPHGGIGHLLTAADFAKGYAIGDTLTDAQVRDWFDTDYEHAIRGALHTFPDFAGFPRLVQLAILNWLWQLGASAPEKFPRATAALQEHKWRAAAAEWLYADANAKRWSKWRLETQHRCEQEAERLQHAAAAEEKHR